MSNLLWRIEGNEIKYIKHALDSGLKGEMNSRLEADFAKKFGVKYAISVNSGTSALHCALAAMNVGPGDEVIVPPLTFAATAFAAMYLGATPVFADVDPNTFTIDPNDIERKISPKTKAIIPVALYGLSADMDPIMNIADKHNLFVLEDCAQCYLGKYKNRMAGTIGDMAIFSFERSKHMTCGNGGMIITDNEELAERSRKFSVLGYSTLKAGLSESKPSKDVIQDPEFNRHTMIGPNYRLPEVCAAMALAQLEKLEELVEMRKKVAASYRAVVDGCKWLKPQVVPHDYVNSYWTYALRLDSAGTDISWRDFRQCFFKEGGDAFYAAWKMTYLEPAMTGYSKGICPVAEGLQSRLIQLKTNYGSVSHAEKQAAVLERTIAELSRRIK